MHLVDEPGSTRRDRVIDRADVVLDEVAHARAVELLVSTMADATIEHDRDLVTDVMMAVGGRMAGETLPEKARPVVEAMAIEEDRVVIRCRLTSTFAQPPRHLHRNDQDEKITHWVSGAVPWDAPDPA